MVSHHTERLLLRNILMLVNTDQWHVEDDGEIDQTAQPVPEVPEEKLTVFHNSVLLAFMIITKYFIHLLLRDLADDFDACRFFLYLVFESK